MTDMKYSDNSQTENAPHLMTVMVAGRQHFSIRHSPQKDKTAERKRQKDGTGERKRQKGGTATLWNYFENLCIV